jgi:hypothetical protein
VLYGINISKVLHTAKMKTFAKFLEEAYDAEFRSGAQIVRTGEGGRTGIIRRISDAEVRGKKAIGGGKFVPRKRYKDRKDIGTKKGSRDQAPTQPRGSATLSPKESARKSISRKKGKRSRKENTNSK